MLDLLQLQRAANHEGCEHLNRLQVFFDGYHAPLFVLACKHSAPLVDIQHHIDTHYGAVGYFGGCYAEY